MTIIETERLVLRELTDEDHERLFGMYQDAEVNRFIGGPPPPPEEYRRRVRETWPRYYRTHGFGLWGAVRKEDGELLGRIGLLSQEIDGVHEVEVGYALGREGWGKGYATEAARASRDWAFRNLAVDHLISIIAPANESSVRVAERNGMTFWKEADFRTVPVHIYRITRREWERLTESAGV